MLLGPPPPPSALASLPRTALANRTLHRVFRAEASSPWWFASVTPETPTGAGGRFDLPAPGGACYLATSAVAAVLEAFQSFTGLLPDAELAGRRRAKIVAPASAPQAANLAAPRARGLGVVVALWGGGPRELTQAWGLALWRAGWRALHHGIAHDPAGRLRGVTLLDTAGAHVPFDDDAWVYEMFPLLGDQALIAGLKRYGITVTRSDIELPIVRLEDSGLV